MSLASRAQQAYTLEKKSYTVEAMPTYYDYNTVDRDNAKLIRNLTKEIRSVHYNTVEQIYAIGRNLNRVKDILGENEWKKWITAEFIEPKVMSETTIRGYCNIANKVDLEGANIYDLEGISHSTILALSKPSVSMEVFKHVTETKSHDYTASEVEAIAKTYRRIKLANHGIETYDELTNSKIAESERQLAVLKELPIETQIEVVNYISSSSKPINSVTKVVKILEESRNNQIVETESSTAQIIAINYQEIENYSYDAHLVILPLNTIAISEAKLNLISLIRHNLSKNGVLLLLGNTEQLIEIYAQIQKLDLKVVSNISLKRQKRIIYPDINLCSKTISLMICTGKYDTVYYTSQLFDTDTLSSNTIIKVLISLFKDSIGIHTLTETDELRSLAQNIQTKLPDHFTLYNFS